MRVSAEEELGQYARETRIIEDTYNSLAVDPKIQVTQSRTGPDLDLVALFVQRIQLYIIDVAVLQGFKLNVYVSILGVVSDDVETRAVDAILTGLVRFHHVTKLLKRFFS